MKPSLHQSVFSAVCGLFLFGAVSTANAGFLVSAMEPNAELNDQFSSGKSSAPSENDSTPNRKVAEQPELDALFAAPSNGGMNTQTVTGSQASATPYAAVASAEPVSTGGLELRMTRQRDRYHPRFIKSRLFRPPRS